MIAMGTVYLKGDDGGLVAMSAQPFDAEADLQHLLAEHPHLLLGEDPDGPGWLLIRKETGVPDAQGAPDRWSLDHLFVDAQAVPTLVEVKRSIDTRIRREVVGQMLDYAANGVRHWPEGSLRAYFTARYPDPESADVALGDFLGDTDPEVFWARVEDNLRAGRIRMVFAADHIPATLQRIIEFLNEQMRPAEVLGVEIRQFRGQGHTTLIPTLVGRTTAARRVKPAASGSYEQDLADADEAVRTAAVLLSQWAQTAGVITRRTPRAEQFLTSDGVFLFQYYPRSAAVEIPISHLIDAGLTDEAEAFRTQLQQLTGRPLSTRHLYFPADALVRHWEQLRTKLLPRYITLRLASHFPDPATTP
jgi:hypothetical protein